MEEKTLEERLDKLEGQMHGLALLGAVILEEKGDRELNRKVRDRAGRLIFGIEKTRHEGTSTFPEDFDMGTMAFLNSFVNILRA